MSQQSNLINRYTSPPRAPQGVINRPRLTTMSDLLQQRRLCLVHAPAGSGKTTLLAQWYESLVGAGSKTVWYSAREADRDPLFFADALYFAVEASFIQVGGLVKSRDESNGLARLLATTARYAAIAPLALFVDDYHFVEGGDGGDTISSILAARIPNLTIVLASRIRPSIPIGRLRVSGEILEVPVGELFFDESETEAFFQASPGLSMSSEESRQMHGYTEGWAAGLRLASLVLGRVPGAFTNTPPTGSHRAFVEYFLEEVILGLPEKVCSFLTMTSILDSLSAGLCDAVTRRNDSNEILSFLEEAQLFVVALPGAQQWYKYHHLFQEFLQARLHSETGTDLTDLHARAARWFIESGSPMDAVRHAFLARRPEWAAEMIESYCLFDYLSHGRFEVFSRWMQQLPRDAREERPLLLFLQVWRSINMRRFLQAEQTLRTIETLAAAKTSRMSVIARETGLDIDGRLHLMRALIGAYGGDLTSGFSHIDELDGHELDQFAFGQVDLDSIHSYLALQAGALELAERLTWRAKGIYDEMAVHWGGLHSRSIAAMCYIARGHMREAESVAEDALRIARSNFGEHSYMVALPSVLLGVVAFDRGEFEKAEQLWLRATPSENTTDVSGLCERVLIATVGLARVYDATGRSGEATNVLVRASRRAYETEDFRFEFQLAVERASRAFRLGNTVEGLREWERLSLHLPEAQRRYPPQAWQIWDAYHVVEARTLIETGQRALALEKLRAVEATAAQQGRTLSALQVARLMTRLGGGNSSVLALQYPELGNTLDIYLDIPHASLPTRANRRPASPADLFANTLTQREEEVLELLRWGLSNSEIANKLNININTVKSHTKNVFSKLGVKSRTQAVLRTMS
ncbi:LuxR C-terminal-related transcriptional regulator [Phyllobacterium bourgognense]|uniref:LuxR family maltose regulon positive regulatory protein n=1 Tax=Phyllobacterium bourgognense TaxID=314236 RepID=A0A368YNR2_9HYPH|nr:LuxR C-terminal-related transcriptional regulator [Phyllobacterium bourgognense]RCW81861.1 LuxR family maltose regulon positive regulatory protein [Phyllobacterium bourgognense]